MISNCPVDILLTMTTILLIASKWINRCVIRSIGMCSTILMSIVIGWIIGSAAGHLYIMTK